MFSTAARWPLNRIFSSARSKRPLMVAISPRRIAAPAGLAPQARQRAQAEDHDRGHQQVGRGLMAGEPGDH
jgi:hypothetical protein